MYLLFDIFGTSPLVISEKGDDNEEGGEGTGGDIRPIRKMVLLYTQRHGGSSENYWITTLQRRTDATSRDSQNGHVEGVISSSTGYIYQKQEDEESSPPGFLLILPGP